MAVPRFVAATLSAGLMVLGTGGVSGRDYPNQSIPLVGFAPGGGGDPVIRLITNRRERVIK